jgi:hypothetical protein
MARAARQRLLPGIQSPVLLAGERVQLLLLVLVETLFFLLLIGDEFFVIAALLQVQSVAFPLLVSAKCGPVLFPPFLVELVFVELRRFGPPLGCRRCWHLEWRPL